MAGIEHINCLHFSDAKLFLEQLRELEQQDPGLTYFRGQTEDWPLIPSACRGNGNEWTQKWITQFVKQHGHEYVRFLDCKWEQESVEEFQLRFELGLRCYIESNILFQFQQLATELNLIDLSNEEKQSAADPVLILDYLKRDKIPLAGQVRYTSLLAQHHGVPTRLLDWTSDIEVAIGFAVSGVPDATGRIVIWAINEWGRKIPSADPDCDEQLFSYVLTATGNDSCRLLEEKPLYGTCLKLFAPLGDNMQEAFLIPPLSETGHDKLHGGQLHRVKVENVDEIYINDQKGNAMIDMWHDRHFYKNRSFQSFDARLSESPIQKDRVYKFTLPYSEIPYLRPQLGDFSVRWIYDLPMYAQFDDDDQPKDSSVEDRRRIREHNFLNMLGQRINANIEWDAFDI